MRLARAALGPFLIGVAVWCAAGTIAVAHPDGASTRVAIPASWLVFLAASTAAALVPGIRRHPLLATPALLTILPWLPVPLPVAALIWTGPLAWAPIGLAAGAAILLSLPALRLGDRVAPWIAAAIALAAGGAAAWSIAPQVPGGDEPHYLMITQSLLNDRDLDLQNNFDRKEYQAYYPGTLRSVDLQVRGARGEAYSIHAPGTAAVVLPGFALAGYTGARLTMLLLAALAAGLVWRAAWLASHDQAAAWFTWAAIAGSVTFLLQSGMIFPDLPGAFATAAAAWAFLRLGDTPPLSTRALVAVSTALAWLPWLHTRFAVLAAGLGIAIGWRLWRQPGATSRDRQVRLAAFFLVPLLSAVAWFGFFYVLYGTFSPTAPYSGDDQRSLRYVPGALVAMLFDGQYGLLPYTPVLAVAVLGARRDGRSLLAIALLYLAAVVTYWMWWGGIPATPARFATAALPLLAAPLALVFTRANPAFRALLWVWLAVSLATAAVVIGIDRGALAWNGRDAQARWLDWLGPVVNLPRAWPSFFWRLSVPAAGQPDLSSEWPFVLHALAAIATIVAIAATMVAVVRTRAASSVGRVTSAVWAVALGVMAASTVGWALDGSSGLDPSRSQMAVLEGTAGGRRPWTIAPMSVRPATSLTTLLRMPAEEPGVASPPPWGVFSRVLPGRYELRFFMTRPALATVSVKLGRTRELATLNLVSLSEQAFVVTVPETGVLVVDTRSDVRSLGGRVEMRPLY